MCYTVFTYIHIPLFIYDTYDMNHGNDDFYSEIQYKYFNGNINQSITSDGIRSLQYIKWKTCKQYALVYGVSQWMRDNN